MEVVDQHPDLQHVDFCGRDHVDGHRCFATGLGFPILGDHGGDIAAQFGLRWTLPDYLRVAHRTLGADLPQFNGEDSWTLPMNARHVIAQDGTIAHAEVNADYTRRPEPSAVFPVLDQWGRRHVA